MSYDPKLKSAKILKMLQRTWSFQSFLESGKYMYDKHFIGFHNFWVKYKSVFYHNINYVHECKPRYKRCELQTKESMPWDWHKST